MCSYQSAAWFDVATIARRTPASYAHRKDVVRHLDVLLLDEEVVDRAPRPRLVREVNYGVDALKVLLVLRTVGVDEVDDVNAIHLLSLTVPVADVEGHDVVLRSQLVEHPAGNVSGCSGYQNFAFRHSSPVLLRMN